LVEDTGAVLAAIQKRFSGELSPLLSTLPGRGFLLDPEQALKFHKKFLDTELQSVRGCGACKTADRPSRLRSLRCCSSDGPWF
jgi:hypothetical protein